MYISPVCCLKNEDMYVAMFALKIRLKPFSEPPELERVICENDVEHVIWHGFFLFEIALLQAILAYQDGYRREAVLSAFSATEAFRREYLITFLSFQTEPTLRNSIKLSERQLGAFVADYWTRFNKIPSTLEARIKGVDMKNLRNRCAHEGYEPTEGETEIVLSEVWEAIYDCLLPEVRIALTERKRKQLLELLNDPQVKGQLLPIHQLLGPFGQALEPTSQEFYSHVFTYQEYLSVLDSYSDPSMLRETRRPKTEVTSAPTPD